jgi:DNA-directed RNA polymerase specialized sigma24 family protein
VSVPGSDAALINAIRSGDPGAYDVLRTRHGAAARRLAVHLERGRASVDDVVDWAFVQVLEAIRRGGGPTDAFRPYLLTAVQRAARDCEAGESTPIPTDDQDIPDPGQLSSAAAGTRPAAVTAFMSLPERWRAVLWHTEIEGAAPAAVASLFGLSAAEAADLADRARDGMAQSAGLDPGGVHAVLRNAVAPAVLGGGATGYLDDLAYNRPEPEPGPADEDAAAGTAGALLLGAPVAGADLADRTAAAGRAGAGAAETDLIGAVGAGAAGAGAAGGAAAGAGTGAGTAGGGSAAEGSAAGTGAAETTALGAGGAAAGAEAAAPASGPGLRPAGRAAWLGTIGTRAGDWWRGASSRQRNAVTGIGVLLVVAAIVGYALTLSPDSAPVAARPSRPVTTPTATAPATSVPPSTPAATATPTAPASVPPAAVINNPAPSAAAPPPPPRLAVSLTVTGPAPSSPVAGVSFAITNNGRAATGNLTARLSMPASVGLIRSGQVGAWNCSTLGTTIACSRGPLPARATTSDFFTIGLNSQSACGRFIGLTVSAGSAGGSASAAIHCQRARTGAQGAATLSAQQQLISTQPAATAPAHAAQSATDTAAVRHPSRPAWWWHPWWFRGRR